MRYTYIKSLCAGLLAVAAVSCDYLDVVPPETADIPDTMKDKSDAINFLYSCYSTVASNYAGNNLGIEQSADETVCPVMWGRLCQVVSWNQMSPTADSNLGTLMLPWHVTYDGLGQVNLFEKILSESTPREVTAADRSRWMAEVKFLRAWYHFRILSAYGPCPIIDHYYDTNTGKGDLPGRSHYDYCVERIVGWLDEAAEDLPATVESNDLGRATSTICKALKSRVLLYAASPLWNGSFPNASWANTSYETPGYGTELVSHVYDRDKWVRARQAAAEAIALATGAGNRALFSLESSENLRQAKSVPLPDIPGASDDFKRKVMQMRYMMTSTETEGNREVIWGVISNPDAWLNWSADAFPHNVIAKDGGGNSGGICTMSPLLEAAQRFYTASGILPEDDHTMPRGEWFESAGYYGREDIIRLNDGREPRFHAWISYDGDEYCPKAVNGAPLIIEARNSMRHGYNPDMFNQDNNTTGYWLKKWAQPASQWRPDGSTNIRRLPQQLIRLAELYLNLAECEAALDNTGAALEALNKVRGRAGVRDLTAADLALMPLTDWVRAERYIELFCEGHRYYDVRRWLIAPEVLRSGVRTGLNAIAKKDPSFEEFNVPTPVDQPFAWDNRMYLLPVKSSEIYNNPQLVQAPGY